MNDLRETILQSAIEAGHTGALLALKKFKELCKKLKLDEVRDNKESPRHHRSTNFQIVNVDQKFGVM